MSEEQGAAPAGGPVETNTQELSPETQRVLVRMTVWQTVIGLAGVFIGLVALYAALQESEAVRRQTAAAVWPIVSFMTIDGVSDDESYFAFRLTNAGVGPARLIAWRMEIAGERVRDWEEVARAAGGTLGPDTQRRGVVSLVMRPGEEIDIFATRDPVLVSGLVAAAQDSASTLEYCYCSIFDECWFVDARSEAPGPEAVDACPDFGDDGFRS